MQWAVCMTSATTWEEAVAEALRLNRVCHQKFGPPTRAHGWTYRVRRRPWGTRHVRWQVFTPYGDLPRLPR